MNFLKKYPLHFNFRHLFSEWKKFFSTKYLTNDLFAGITVAFVAIPLSLAIALASGVSPGAGLITAIIAGIVCALFGGAPLSVSGPAAAMSVLIADTVEKVGLEGLIFICLLAGLMQLLSGMIGLGKLGRYVPIPVIAGFTAGIGVIILIGQLPRAFGLLPPAESNTIDVFIHIKEYMGAINWTCLGLVIATIAIIRGLPKVLPRVPAILIAVIAVSLAVYFLRLSDVPLIGNIPQSLPLPKIPALPNIPISELLVSAFTIYLLASLETLLSTTAIDKLTHEKKHDANQELIGQGLGNISVSFFGGIPVTSVIARSATNVRSGAKTRRASIIHSLIILLAIFAIAPLISKIPIVALAGVLFSVAFSMINYAEFKNFWRTSPSEGMIYTITFFTIIFVDLLAGVQAGMIAAGLIILFKAAKTNLLVTSSSADGIIRLSIAGSLTFLSSRELSELQNKLEGISPNQTVILDLTTLTNLDSSGAEAIIELFNDCKDRHIKFYIKGLPRRFERTMQLHGGQELLEKYYLISENDLKQGGESSLPLKSSHERLIHGLHIFYNDSKNNDRRLFEHIANKQDPHTIFIACSDSRIIPTLLTSTEPGELFTIRNVGNCIPPYDSLPIFSEAAAIEFALANLNISDIVICGHANCGAIKACNEPNTNSLPPKLKSWIDMMKSQLIVNRNFQLNDVARMNVLNQIENLKNYPIFREKRAEGRAINVHGWFFDFEENLVYEWDKMDRIFKPILRTQSDSII
jgi:carbonic anhydrase